MLTDAEYEILCFVQGEHSRRRIDVLNNFIRKTDPKRTDALIKNLVDGGSLRMDLAQNVRIAPSGVSAMSMYEQAHNEKAEQRAEKARDDLKKAEDTKKQFKHDWRVALVSACVGAVLALVIEHLVDILIYVRVLFH